MIPSSQPCRYSFCSGLQIGQTDPVFKEMYKMGRAQFIPFIVTILGIVFTDLLLGIAMGMVVAIFHILWNNYKKPYHFEHEAYVKGEPIRIQLSEDVSFLNKARILRTLSHLPEDSTVIIDARNTKNIHPDILEIIEDFKANAESKDIQLEIQGLSKTANYDPVKQFALAVAGVPIKKNGKVKKEVTT